MSAPLARCHIQTYAHTQARTLSELARRTCARSPVSPLPPVALTNSGRSLRSVTDSDAAGRKNSSPLNRGDALSDAPLLHVDTDYPPMSETSGTCCFKGLRGGRWQTAASHPVNGFSVCLHQPVTASRTLVRTHTHTEGNPEE